MAASQRTLPYGHHINGNGQLVFDSLTLPPYEGDRENKPQRISDREKDLRGLPRVRQCILNRRPIRNNLRRDARTREAVLTAERGVRRHQVCQYCLRLQQNGSTRFLVGCLVSPREPNGKCLECNYKHCACLDNAGPPMAPAAPPVPFTAPVAPVTPVAQPRPRIFFPPTFAPPMAYPTYLTFAPGETLQRNLMVGPPLIYVPQVAGIQAQAPLQNIATMITPPRSLDVQPVATPPAASSTTPPAAPRTVQHGPLMMPLAIPGVYPTFEHGRNPSVWSDQSEETVDPEYNSEDETTDESTNTENDFDSEIDTQMSESQDDDEYEDDEDMDTETITDGSMNEEERGERDYQAVLAEYGLRDLIEDEDETYQTDDQRSDYDEEVSAEGMITGTDDHQPNASKHTTSGPAT